MLIPTEHELSVQERNMKRYSLSDFVIPHEHYLKSMRMRSRCEQPLLANFLQNRDKKKPVCFVLYFLLNTDIQGLQFKKD